MHMNSVTAATTPKKFVTRYYLFVISTILFLYPLDKVTKFDRATNFLLVNKRHHKIPVSPKILSDKK